MDKKAIRDLSLYHYPVSNLFPTMSAREAWERYHLSDEQITFFQTYGYLYGIRVMDDHHISHLLRELDEIKDPSHPGNSLLYEFHTNESTDPNAVLFHSLGHWRVTPGFHDVLWNPAFVIPASQLLGDRAVRFWHDQLFCKPASFGGVVAWHQDYSYWTRTLPMQHLTCWVGLDDVSIQNGCMHYIPQSHQWGLLKKPTLAGNINGLQEYLNPEQKKQFDHKVPIEMKKGYAAFHHPLMVHGSYENKSPSPRRALVINVFADGTVSDSDAELLHGVPVIEKGKKMEGQFFPLLYDPKK